MSLECKQVYNGLEFCVLRSKASQLEDGKERKKGEEDRRQGSSGISTAPWQGWACCGMVMAIGSSEAKVLACPEPLLLGFRGWLCLEPQEAVHLLLPKTRDLWGLRTSISQGGKEAGAMGC